MKKDDRLKRVVLCLNKRTLILCVILMFSISAVFAQSLSVIGSVKDQSGDPLIGVVVKVNGHPTIGTFTDANGKFTLSVPKNATLDFSFVGYTPKTEAASGIMNIVMSQDIKVLDEVVAIGYGTVKKRDLTGAVASIKNEDIVLAPTSNVMEALQGRISGLDITKTSGQIGSDVSILLHGSRSIYGSNKPLFIIDGVQGGDYNSLSPSDIETIDVLKDASSTAIYGSAGANGVIIITTKQGKSGKAKVNFDFYYGVSGAPDYKHGMRGSEWETYQQEAYTYKNGVAPSDMSVILTNSNYLDAYNQGKWIDWVDDVAGRTAVSQKYSLSVSSGTEKSKLFASTSYQRETGLLSNDNLNRYQLRLNMEQEILPKTKIGFVSNLLYQDKNSGNSKTFTSALTAFPLGDSHNSDGSIKYEYIENQYTPLGDMIKNQYVYNTKSTNVSTTGFIETNPIDGLTIKTQINGSIFDSRLGQYFGEECNANIPTYAGTPCAQITNNKNWSYSWDNIISYKKNLFTDHEFGLTAASTWTKSVSETSLAEGSGQSVDAWSFYRLLSASGQYVLSDYTQFQKMGLALRFNYSYKGRYLLNLSNRWDGVSWLADGHKWASFPAGAVAWRISDESFMKSTQNWLDNLKLRVGFGITGNDGGISPYQTSPQTYWYTSSGVSVNGKIVPFAQYTGTFSGSDLSWEKSYNWNLGLDFSVVKNRIDGSIEWFHTITRGLLFKRTLPVTSALTGWGSPLSSWQNIAKTQNKGIDITINSRNIIKKNFIWNSALSFSWEKEKIDHLLNGDLISSNLFEGQPINSFYGYKYVGIWSTNESDEASQYGAKPGFIKIKTLDKDGDGGIHAYGTSDRQVLGHNNPNFVIGLNNTFRFKNIDLSVFTMARLGQMIESDLLGYYTAKYSPLVNQISGVNYWTETNQGAYYPRPGTGDDQSVVYSSLQYRDGSFLKIKNITLGYTLPKALSGKIMMDKLRLYATAYNPYIWVKDKQLKGTDPENNGSDSFPLYKQFVFGLNITF